jgi:hypothetical protein
MKFWRGLTQRTCPNCGQRELIELTMVQRVAQRNLREGRLAELFGRKPRAQSCRKCGRLVFEGEAGFEWDPLLLIDWDARKRVSTSPVSPRRLPSRF